MSITATLRRRLRPLKRAYRAVNHAAGAALPQLLRPLHISIPAVVDGVRWRIPLIRGIGLENRQGHEPWMTDLLRRLIAFTHSPGLIDVGVNVGQTLLKLKSINPALRYYGFEPNPFCVLFAVELIRLNDFQDCEVYPTALSDAPALLGFVADSEADPAGSMLEDFRPGKESHRKQHIAALVFDNLGLTEAESCGLVKIDVEGAELHVLRGMARFLKERRPVVICEVLHAHSEAKVGDLAIRNRKLIETLKAADFVAMRLRKGPSAIEGVDPVTAFPDVVWDNATSWELCDYLLVPTERADAVTQLFT